MGTYRISLEQTIKALMLIVRTSIFPCSKFKNQNAYLYLYHMILLGFLHINQTWSHYFDHLYLYLSWEL